MEIGQPSERDAHAPDQPGQRERGQASKLHVLLVDDSLDTREAYGLYLQFCGLAVETAGDGDEALRFVDSSPPDAIVLDLAMPRVTGWDVMRELKANPTTRGIPIIALSGQDAQESAFKAGANAYCSKPCAPG